MSFTRWICPALLGVAVAARAAPPATAPATRPAVNIPDHCDQAVDPYHPGLERVRFFQAAGVDNEIDAEEFAAARGKPNSFVRVFDHWAQFVRYDRTGDKTLDWFEADAYRRALRKRVLAAHDADKNGRLTGAERLAANRALAAGKILLAEEPPAAAVPPALLERFDTDGDGQLSEAERLAASERLREDSRKEWLARYDRDEDGKLGAEERAAMMADLRRRRKPWQDMFDRFNVRHFDTDGDGKLSKDEKTELWAFQKDLQKIGKDFETRQMLIDRKVIQWVRRCLGTALIGFGAAIAAMDR